MREHLDHANVHDPADLAPGEPPDEAFEEPVTTDVESVIDGTGRVVVDTDGSEPKTIVQIIGEVAEYLREGLGIHINTEDHAIRLLRIIEREDESGELLMFRRIRETSQRLQAKIEAEPPEDWWSHDNAHAHPGPVKRWRQLEDGTYVSDRVPGPPLTVVVERRTPADLPFIQIIGRSQEIQPDTARWLANRLLEATGIVETAVIP